jgi:hypothetical protein
VINRFVNKFLDLLFNIFVRVCLIYANIKIKPFTGVQEKRKILLLPYYPENYPGGYERIAKWKEFFDKNTIDCDVKWACDEVYYKNHADIDHPFKRYQMFFKITRKRVALLKSIHEYDAVWVQRAFIPHYPFARAYFEKVLKKHGNIIYDFYDADYNSNFQYVVDTITYGNKITVASDFLLQFCQKYNPKSYLIPFAFDYSKYPIKKYVANEKIIIGWAGSPENFQNVVNISPYLQRIEQTFPFVSFVFVCNTQFETGLKRVEFVSWNDEDFDYMETLARFDIGINPMLRDNDVTKAKVSFKCLEYMSLGITFLTSPNGIPSGLIHNENTIIVQNKETWFDELSMILNNKEHIQVLGKNARHLVENSYQYSKNVDTLLEILVAKK